MVYNKAAFSERDGHSTVAITSFVFGTDSVDFATNLSVTIMLVQSLKNVVVGASGDSCELQKTI